MIENKINQFPNLGIGSTPNLKPYEKGSNLQILPGSSVKNINLLHRLAHVSRMIFPRSFKAFCVIGIMMHKTRTF